MRRSTTKQRAAPLAAERAVEIGRLGSGMRPGRAAAAARRRTPDAPALTIAAHAIGERAQRGPASSGASPRGRRRRARAADRGSCSAAAFASGPVLPTGPTQPGQPFSHSHSAISVACRVEQLVVHAEQRLAEADAARIVVVDEDRLRLVRRRRRSTHRRLLAGVDRDADVVADRTSAAAARPAASRTPGRRRRRGDRRTRTAARAITAAGIVSQYDVVCICCSGRSSSPEPTFSFV